MGDLIGDTSKTVSRRIGYRCFPVALPTINGRRVMRLATITAATQLDIVLFDKHVAYE
jgi:hypothetical protein